jgi:hypothetical protein
MARIPDTEAAAPQLTTESVSPRINPEMAGSGLAAMGRVAGEFADRLQRLQISQEITKGSLDIENQLDTVAQSIQQGGDYQNGGKAYSAAVGNLSSQIDSQYSGRVADELKNRLLAKSIVQSHQLDAWSYNMTKDAAQQTMAVTLDKGITAGSQATGAARQLIKTQRLADIQNHVGTVYTPADAIKTAESFKQNFDYNAAATDIASNPQSALAALKDPKQYSDLMPDQRARLTMEAKSQVKQKQAVDSEMLASQMRDQIGSAYKFGKYDPSVTAKVEASGDPVKVADYKARLQLALNGHTVISQLGQTTPEQGQALVQQLQPKPGQDHFDQREQMYQMAQKQLNQVDELRQKDPAALVASQIKPGLPGMQVEQSIALQKQIGVINPQPLPKATAESMVTRFNSTDPAARPAFLNSLKGQYGQNFQPVMRQLFANKLPPEAMFMDDATPKVALDLSNVMNISEVKLKENAGDNTKSTLLSTDSMFATVAQTLPPGPQTINAMKQSYDKLALYYAAQGDKNAAKDAFNGLFGNYHYDGTWRFPSWVKDPNQIKSYAAQVIDKSNTMDTGPNPPEIFKSAAQHGRWVLSSDGNQYNLYVNGVVARNKDGSPVSFTVANAMLSDYKAPQVGNVTKQNIVESAAFGGPSL